MLTQTLNNSKITGLTARKTMQKKDLINLIDNILKPVGFVMKGNTWKMESQELVKIINLQKSTFGNLYYINYGFDLKGLNYDGTTMHIFRGLVLKDDEGSQLLDFDNELSPEYRSKQIVQVLQTVLLKELLETKNVTDLKRDLNSRTHLNDVPLKVKEFLGLSVN